jgi:hypothetical protein
MRKSRWTSDMQATVLHDQPIGSASDPTAALKSGLTVPLNVITMVTHCRRAGSL